MPQNLEKRGDIWYFRAVIGGKLYRRSTEFHDLKSAQRRAADFERDIRAGIVWGEKPIPIFRTWAEKCLGIITAGKRQPERDVYSVQHGIDRWGDQKLDAIKPTDCAGYITWRLEEGAAKGTIQREVVILSRIFKLAVADEILRTNPWAEVKKPHGDARTRVLTLEEEQILRGHLATPWQEWLTVALLTGMRVSEQLHLRPVDVRGGLIHVAEFAKGGKRRVIPVRPEVDQVLATLQPERDQDPYWPANYEIVSHTFDQATAAAGLSPKVRLHDLRRTFGTRCAEAGMLPLHLKDIMGHASVETTSKYYVHLQRLSIIEAMTRVELPVLISQ